jgi:hypothetical protein
MREILGESLLLEKRLRLDLGEFELDEVAVFGEVAEFGKYSEGFAFAIVVDEPTRGEGHEDHTDTKDERGNELQSEWEEPRGFLLPVTGATDVVLGGAVSATLLASDGFAYSAIVNPETDHDTQRNGQLLETN